MASEQSLTPAIHGSSEISSGGGTGALFYRYRKLFSWFRLLAGFTSAQLFIQALGFLSGILVVRSLSKEDYAWFTIANTLVAVMSMLADSGISGALTAVGGTVWQDNARFGSLIRTALTLRRRLAVGSVLVVTPAFIWMLAKNHASSSIIAVVVPTALFGFFLQITAGVLGVVISLRQELRRMQFLGLVSALLRLLLLAPACIVFIDARIAVLIGTCTLAFQVCILHRWVSTSIHWAAPVSVEYSTQIVSVVKKQAPLTIFFCLQGQITTWLISIFGSAERVAEIGALGRFAMIFTLISSVMNSIVVPRFARCQDPDVLMRRYWQVAGGFAVMAGSLVVFATIFPHLLLWVLGANYAHLEQEVCLMMLSAALSSMFGTLTALTFCKAWIVPAIVSIPMELATQVLLILVLDISTVRGVLLVGCLGSLAPIVLNMIVAQLAMRKLVVSQADS